MKRLLVNPLAAPQPKQEKEERLFNAVFANYEALDTPDALDNALRNLEMAIAAAGRWKSGHEDANGFPMGATNDMLVTFEEEEHALWLLSGIYARRAELLGREDSDEGK